MSDLLRPSGWLLSGALLSRGTMLVAWVWTARLVAPGQYGELNLMQTAITLLSAVAGLGLALAVTRQVAASRASDPLLAGRYVGCTLLFTAVAGAGVAAVLLAAQPFFAGVFLHNRELGALIAASSGAVVFSALAAALQAALLGLEAFREAALAQWAQGFAGAVGLVVGTAAGAAQGGLIGFSIGWAVACAVCFALLAHVARAQGLRLSYRLGRPELSELTRYGAPTLLGSIVISAAMLGAQVILSHRHDGYEQVGMFSLAYRWHLAILFVPAAVAPAMLPVMTRHATREGGGDVRPLFRGTMWGMLCLAAVPALVVAVGAPLLLGLSGRFYAHHPFPLIVLAIAAVPAALNNALSNASVSIGLIRAWLLSDLVLAIVLAGVAAILAGSLQSSGVALAYLAAYIATDLALSGPLSRRLRALPAGT
jgi:O-antigen/teichoic acid export membrane protein